MDDGIGQRSPQGDYVSKSWLHLYAYRRIFGASGKSYKPFRRFHSKEMMVYLYA